VPGSPIASAEPAERPSVGELLPRELDGVELHTFAVSSDVLARLADAAGVAVEELEVAYASEHGARFIQMLAIRHPAIEAERLRDLFAQVAYGAVVDAMPTSRTEEVAGVEDVLVTEDPELAPRLGVFYSLVRGDALVVVQAFARVDAEAAITALPAR
jgi:hypothetical protein